MEEEPIFRSILPRTGDRGRSSPWLPLLSVGLLVLALAPAISSADPVQGFSEDLLDEVDYSVVMEHVANLQALGTRYPGTKGYYEAAEYLVDVLEGHGLEFELESFNHTVLVDYGSNLTLLYEDGTEVTVGALTIGTFSVETASTSVEGKAGELAYAGLMTPADLSGKDFSQKIALVEFDVGRRWADLVTLGARAFVFVEPERYSLRETFTKDFAYLPIDVPRVVIQREVGEALRRALEAGERILATIRSSSRYEDRELLNVIARVQGTDPEGEAVIAISHFDSFSPILSEAPGASEAAGAALALEFSNYFSAHQPRRDVIFAFFSGHGQMLAGARDYLDRHFSELRGTPIAINLDVSGYGESVSLFDTGAAYCVTQAYRSGRVEWALDTIKYEIVEPLVRDQGRRYEIFGGLSEEQLLQLTWQDVIEYERYAENEHLPSFSGFYVGQHEPFSACGGVALAVTDAASERPLSPIYTPSDLIEEGCNVSENRLPADLAFLALNHFANGRVENRVLGPERCAGQLGFTTMSGRVSEYNESDDTYAPVANALVMVAATPEQASGMARRFFFLVVRANGTGHFEVPGLLPGSLERYSVTAFVDEPLEGPAEKLPNFGAHAISHEPLFGISGHPHRVEVNVFSGGAFAAFSVLDPGSATPIPLCVLPVDHDTQEEAPGFAYYSHLSYFDPAESWGADLQFLPDGRRVDVLYMRDRPTPKVIGVLNNATEGNPFGSGYAVELGGMILVPQEEMAIERTMDLINSHRMGMAEEKGLFSPTARIYYEKAKEYEERGLKELEGGLYYEARSDLRAAWAFQADAHGALVGMLVGATSTTFVYLLFLLPFAFILERLLFGYRGLRRRLSAVAAIFVGMTLVLYAVHPGFRLTGSFWMVGLTFVMAVFGGTALILILVEGYDYLKEIRAREVGARDLGISRVGATSSALLVGIRNMRRRRLRSSLVIFSIAMVTAAMVSSVTMATALLPRRLSSTEGTTIYNGLLVRDETWLPLDPRVFQALREGYPDLVEGASHAVWAFPPPGRGHITASFGAGGDRGFVALLGLSWEGAELMGLDAILIEGSWIREKDLDAVLVDQSVARGLSLDLDEKVTVMGLELRVKGTYDGSLLDGPGLLGLDGYPLTPNDVARRHREVVLGPTERLAEERLEFFAGRDVMIVHPKTAEALGGRTTAMMLKVREEVTWNQLHELSMDVALRTKLSVFSGLDGLLARFSPSVEQEAFGLSAFAVLALILAVTVLNTMVSAVHERRRDIFTYSSVGMAPIHVGSLFLAQAVASAIVGGMLGYVLGTSMPLAFDALGLPFLRGVHPNYSSLWVPASLVIVTLVAALSTLYPMRKASSLVTPSVSRERELPPPSGDEWLIPLPFTSPPPEVDGLVRYLTEYFERHGVEREADFVVDRIRIEEAEGERTGEAVKSVVLLTKHAPWDFDVRNEIRVRAILASEGPVKFDVCVKRIAGFSGVWKRGVRAFIGGLRKQFLIWRALSPGERRRYVERSQLEGEGA